MAGFGKETPTVKRTIVHRKVKMQKQNDEYLDVIITDFTLDTAKPRKPKSLGRMISVAIKNKKPGRAFTTDLKNLDDGQPEFAFDLGPKFQKLEEQAKAEGKKLRLLYPKGGVPIFAGKSTIEFLEARKRRS